MSPSTYDVDLNKIQKGTYVLKINTDVQFLYLYNILMH